MHSDWKAIREGAWLFFATLAAAGVVALFVMHQVLLGGDPSESANENSPIEIFQLGLLLASSCLMAFSGAKNRDFREGHWLVGALLLCMAIRECDSIFDNLLFHGAWFPFALAVAAIAGVAALAHWGRAVAGLADVVRDWHFPLLSSGMSIIFVFSRLLGQKKIWIMVYRDICGEEHAHALSRAMKNIAEEGTELFGYALVALWALFFLLKQKHPRRP